MRKRINDRLYTTRLCIEHLGTANPGPADIRNWKESWSMKYTVPISGHITSAQKVLKEQEIPPLLYDIRSNNWDWGGGDFSNNAPSWYGQDESNRFVVFYIEEDYILFKLLYKNA